MGAVIQPCGVKFEDDDDTVGINVPFVAGGDVVVMCEMDDDLELEVVEFVNAGAALAKAIKRPKPNIFFWPPRLNSILENL